MSIRKLSRLILLLTIILSVASSCATDTIKDSHNPEKFDTLPVPKDSSAFYFKIKPDWKDNTPDALDSFVNGWYSKMLFALKEPILKDYRGKKEIYRFTWLRTFHHPAVVRLEKQGDVVHLFSKVSDGAGGYEPGKIIFDTALSIFAGKVDTINQRLDEAGFWTLKTEKREENGFDGSEWIVEVYKNHKYHMVVRWTPGEGTFRSIGEYLLSISEIKTEATKNADY